VNVDALQGMSRKNLGVSRQASSFLRAQGKLKRVAGVSDGIQSKFTRISAASNDQE